MAAALVCVAVYIAPTSAQQSARADADVYRQFTWRHIGPEGNRVSAVVGVPGDPRVYYVGAPSGGIFKTSDGGMNWQAIFDDQPVASIGSLAVARSDANVIWAAPAKARSAATFRHPELAFDIFGSGR